MDDTKPTPEMLSHAAHWGVFRAGWQDGKLVVQPHPGDPDPNPILQNFPDALRHRARIAQPMARRGWLENGPGASDRRGRDEMVPISWERALDLVAAELKRVRENHGPQGIFGGSYGWASAGRFHHAQSQLHRFLNLALDGYVRSVNSYSAGASAVIMPHVFGPIETVCRRAVTWEQIATDTEVLVAFGGMALKNSMVGGGGVSQHVEKSAMERAAARGCDFILVSPLRSDLPGNVTTEWVAPRPGSDVALMLGIAHSLASEGLQDQAFLERYCEGWSEFEGYLLGRSDGQPKDAAWAAARCNLPADSIVALARRLAGKRSLIVVAHSLQRAEHGEQPVWMALVLAAMLGQIGLPGGGYGYAMGSLAHYGRRATAVPVEALPQGRNGVKDFIPVARIADMLLNPGQPFDYNGQRHSYPDIKLVYWVGGNPFHHHQDLNRLRDAFAQVDTLIVQDFAWTASARHADLVLPCTMTLEREDISATSADPLMVAMHQLAEPYGQSRDDYAIFSALAERLGRGEVFTEGRSARQWLEHLYAPTQKALELLGLPAPDFEAFWAAGEVALPQHPDDGGFLAAFRVDPVGHPLPTASGKVQITSQVIAGFGYDDCPGHPVWLEFEELPTPAQPLWLVANQPATRLHSQLDFGGHSAEEKRRGREVLHLHPADAAARGIQDGDIVRLHNARGACLAAARLSEGVLRGVAQLPTGAWYDPDDASADKPLCVHGNPNVLTRDVGTSRLAQGCIGQLTTVEVERFTGNLPPIQAFEPPPAGRAAAE